MNSTNYSSSILPANCPGYEALYSFNTITLTTEIKSTWISLQVVNGVAAPVAFAINLLIIWTILEKESLRTNKSNILLAALAFTDILVNLFIQPSYISLTICFLLDNCTVPCEVFVKYSIAQQLPGILSLSSLMMVSVERYIAVQRPFLYQNISFKKVVLTAIFNWLLSSSLGIMASILRSRQSVGEFTFQLVFITIEILVTFFCTVRVQIAAYRQSREIVAQAVQVLGQATEEQKQEHKKRYQESKKTISMCILVFSSFVMYCPFLAIAIAGRLRLLGDNFAIAAPVGITIGLLQSLVNPLITLRLSYIRKPVLRKLRNMCGFTFRVANEQ